MTSTKLLMSSYIFGFTSCNLEGCFQGKTLSQPLKVLMLQTNFSINLCTAVSWKNIPTSHIPHLWISCRGSKFTQMKPTSLVWYSWMTLTSTVTCWSILI